MSRPFSFFQTDVKPYPPSGVPFIPSLDFLTGSGYYFSTDLEKGKTVGFIWRIIEHDSLILRPIRFNIRASGRHMDGNNEYANVALSFSGNIFPVSVDSGDYSMSFSGQQKDGSPDTVTWNTPWTGSVSGISQDTNDFNLSFSGGNPTVLNDLASLETVTTAKQSGTQNELSDWTLSFSGRFFKKDKDTASVDFVFSQITYEVGAATITINTGDTASIDFVFKTIEFKPNGG